MPSWRSMSGANYAVIGESLRGGVANYRELTVIGRRKRSRCAWRQCCYASQPAFAMDGILTVVCSLQQPGVNHAAHICVAFIAQMRSELKSPPVAQSAVRAHSVPARRVYSCAKEGFAVHQDMWVVARRRCPSRFR